MYESKQELRAINTRLHFRIKELENRICPNYGPALDAVAELLRLDLTGVPDNMRREHISALLLSAVRGNRDLAARDEVFAAIKAVAK